MRRLAFLFLISGVAASGCAGPSAGRYDSTDQFGLNRPDQPASERSGNSSDIRPGQQVAILLPMTGPRSDLGQVLLQAAQLALAEPEGPKLEVLDTGGTPSGAAAATSLAVGHGDVLILGPLTSGETSAVAPIAQDAGIPVLAFSNDSSLSKPGVWPLGIAPGQQVQRLVAEALAKGKSQFAALLPDSGYGHAMGDSLRSVVQADGSPEPDIKFHGQGMAAITSAARDVSAYETRRGPIDRQVKALRAQGTATARKEAQNLARTPIQPPPFDVLLLADTGDELQEIAAVLPYFDVDRAAVQIVGPALWADASSGSASVTGAWYAAPDNTMRENFNAAFRDHYGTPAPPLADLAFDAASIARSVMAGPPSSGATLTRPDGFIGSDGWIRLLATGEVSRGLAVYQISRSGPTLIEPAPGPGL